jgi:hypothetical protein
LTKPPTCDDKPAAIILICTAFATGLEPNGVSAAKAPPTPADSSPKGIGIGAANRLVEVEDAMIVTVTGVSGDVTSEITVTGGVLADPR